MASGVVSFMGVTETLNAYPTYIIAYLSLIHCLSPVKQIGARIKIVGAQWNEKNVPQILRLRCAYLNNHIKLSISA